MSLPAFQGCLTACWLLLGASVGALAQESRPVEYSEPRLDGAKTNLVRLEQGRSGLERIESELSRPFEFMSRPIELNSMEGRFLPAPPLRPPSAVNSARIRELIELRYDLPFMTTEEVFKLNPDADRYRAPELTPDGRDRNRLRPIERALLDAGVADPIRLGAAPRAAADRVPRDIRRLDDDPRDPLRDRLDMTAQDWRPRFPGVFGAGAPDAGGARLGDDLFGHDLGRPPGPSLPSDAELQRIEAFRQLYDFGNTRPEMAGQELSRSSPMYLDRSFFAPPTVETPAPVAAAPGVTFGVRASASPSFTAPPQMLSPAPSTAAAPPAPSPFLAVPRRPF